MSVLIKNIVFFGCGFSFLLCIGQLFTKESPKKYLVALILFRICWMLLRILYNDLLMSSRLLIYFPHLTFSMISGIALYIYCKLFVCSEKIKQSKYYILYLIISTALIIDILIIGFTLNSYLFIIRKYILIYTEIVGMLIFITFILVCVRSVFTTKNFADFGQLKIIASFLPLYSFIIITFGAVGCFMQNRLQLNIAGCLTTLLVVLFFIVTYRYPHLVNDINAKKNKYTKCLLNDSERNYLYLKLKHMMSEEKIYIRDDCNLAYLAQKIDTTPNRLSEFLNNDLQVSFNDFINGYRIEEAKKILIERRDLNVLEVAFVVGFGNKTSFNKSFLKVTGTTPNKFRYNYT